MSKPAEKAEKPAHPTYEAMAIQAITTLKDRGGSSQQAIVKYIQANYSVQENARIYINQALKRAVKSKKIIQTKGTGASGSFKNAPVEKKPKVVKPKKPVVKKPKSKDAAKAKAKKAAGKAKKATAKSPKKVASKKTPKKTKSAKKPASKKSATKKPAAKKVKKTPKKTPVKKAASK